MAFDYSGLLNVADTLITDFGRAVSLQRLNDAPADSAKPWGPKESAGGESIDTIGVFLTKDHTPFDAPSTVDQKIGRVLVPAVPTLPEELTTDWRVLDPDSGNLFEITVATAVKPGPTLLYYDLEIQL